VATIKVQVDESGTRRVITKLVDGNRLVSCACCESGECCVYPASCGIGPESVEHYGSTIAGSGTSFGDTTNGVILEDGVWAIYRNGSRSTKSCLGLALPSLSVNVAAVLATTYILDVTLAGGGSFTSFMEYSGALDTTGNPCFWDDFGGIYLLFNQTNCRWELTEPSSGPFAYISTAMPIGSYTIIMPTPPNPNALWTSAVIS